MFWKRFYFVVILISCSCFFLTCEWFCEVIKKIFGCGKPEKTTNFGQYVNLYNNNNSGNGGGSYEDNDSFAHATLIPKCIFLSATISVGKTSILKILKNEKFDEKYISTVFFDLFQVQHENVGNNIGKEISLLDVSGNEKYREQTTLLYDSANAIVFVYDITKIESFNNLNDYITEVKTVAEEKAKGCLFFLLGNKLDMDSEKKRQVPKEEAQKLAGDKKLIFLGECSAKNNTYKPSQELYYKKGDLAENEECKDGLHGMLNDVIFSVYNCKKN